MLLAQQRAGVEFSHKYTVGAFAELAREAGFERRHVWVDADDLFSVHYYGRV